MAVSESARVKVRSIAVQEYHYETRHPLTWRDYHEATKHSVDSLRRFGHSLDWANMPDPFRHYEGAPVLDLPADPPPPEAGAGHDGPAILSQLLFYSAAISASKRVPSTGYKYALRVNPSSGNLHPTEFHFITRALKNWPDGLYHYRPSSHTAEQRALGPFTLDNGVDFPIVFILTSIAWREAWKYRDRAYRYCLHDIGHAWQALAMAAAAAGCESLAIGNFADDELARLCRFHTDEWPMLILGLRGPAIPLDEPDTHPREILWSGGKANRLSTHYVEYPLIEGIHAATKLEARGELQLTPAAASVPGFGQVARRRRSALDFRGGALSMTMEQLSAILAATGVGRYVQLYLYVHRVEGLQPGVYRHSPPNLKQIRAGDQRVIAAGLSLGQELAGNACIAFSMIAGLDYATRKHGDRGYRYAHFEAGAIGHRLYLAAEALGLQATGIGAFYDDQVHSYLELTPQQGQVIYHFAIGHAVPDPRLTA